MYSSYNEFRHNVNRWVMTIKKINWKFPKILLNQQAS